MTPRRNRRSSSSDLTAGAPPSDPFLPLLEATDDVYWILEGDPPLLTYVSPSFERAWGFSIEAAREAEPHWASAIAPPDRAAVQAALDALPATRRMEIEYRLVLKNGSVRWIRDRATWHPADGDAPARIAGVAEDITEKRAAETAFRNSQARLALALGASRLHVWSLDAATLRLDLPDSLSHRFGVDAARSPRLGPWRRRLHAEDRPRLEQAVRAALAGRARLEQEFRLRRADGGWSWLAVQADMAHESGQFRLHGVCADVTEPREKERILRERNERLRLALDAAGMGTWTVELDTGAITVGPDFRRIVGLEADRPVGASLLDRLAPADFDRLRGEFLLALQEDRRFEAEVQATGDDGRTRWISAQAIVIRDEGRDPVKVLGVVADVTARLEADRDRGKLLEREQVARAQAETSARARDEFLAVVSHELRSPLNAIQSWTHVIETQVDAKASPLVHRALTGVRTGVDQQVRLIEDLLDATRIMTGKLSLKRTPLHVLPVVEAALGSVRTMADTRGVRLQVSLSIKDEQVEGDRDRLQQIFWNLLSNAVKFSQDGGTVHVGAAAEDGQLAVRVRDEGKGIDPAFLPHIFDRFTRFERASQRGHDGLGLGLALVKHLCALHGGSVSADSRGNGLGATFTVRLPLLKVERTAILAGPDPIAGRPPSNALGGLRVMLIDDQVEAREAVAAVLRHAGAEVAAFASGSAALAHLEAAPLPWPLDVLVSDIAMPGEDGYTTLARIRVREQRNGDGHTLPAIALTAFATADDRHRALEAGFELHMAKPVGADDLIAAVAASAGRIIVTG